MKTLIIVGGLPGVGKSFVARMLASKLKQALYFDSDFFAKQLFDEKRIDFVSMPPAQQRQQRLLVHKAIIEKIAKDFNQFEIIILDTNFDIPESRDMFYQFSASFDVHLLVIEVVCPEEIVKRRIMGGEKSMVIGDRESMWSAYQRMKAAWVHLTKPHTVIESDDDIENQVKKFIKAKLS
jgi:predicted kinase